MAIDSSAAWRGLHHPDMAYAVLLPTTGDLISENADVVSAFALSASHPSGCRASGDR